MSRLNLPHLQGICKGEDSNTFSTEKVCGERECNSVYFSFIYQYLNILLVWKKIERETIYIKLLFKFTFSKYMIYVLKRLKVNVDVIS